MRFRSVIPATWGERTPGADFVWRVFDYVLAGLCVWVASEGTFINLSHARPATFGLAHTALGWIAKLSGVWLFTHAIHRSSAAYIARTQWPLAGVFGWLTLACTWSPAPSDSLRYVAGSLPVFLAFSSFGVLFSYRESVSIVAVSFGFGFALTGILTPFESPFLRTPDGVMGVWNHRNFLGHATTLGIVCSICSFALASKDQSHQRKRGLENHQMKPKGETIAKCICALIALSGAYWLKRSGSLTPLLTLASVAGVVATVVGYTFLLRRSSRSAQAFLAIVVTSVLFVLASATFVLARHSSAEEFRGPPRLVNLSWRTSFWRLLGPHLRDGFLTGFGPNQMFFREGNRASQIAKSAGMAIPHAHNGFLDAMLEGGIFLLLGIAVLAVLALRVTASTTKRNPTLGATMGCVVVAALTLNLTEPDFLMTMRPTLLLLVIVANYRFDESALPARTARQAR